MFDFKFANILCRVYKILLGCFFNCHKLAVKNHQSKVECFIRYFSKKDKFDFFKKICFNKKCVVEWKEVVGCYRGHETIILFFLIYGFKEKTSRFYGKEMAIYKTRNTGTGNRMRGTRGIGGMLYSEEYCQTFRGMSSNIPWNVAKHFGECPRKIQRTFKNNLGLVVKHFVESMKALDTGDHEFYLLVEEPLLINSTSEQLG